MIKKSRYQGITGIAENAAGHRHASFKFKVWQLTHSAMAKANGIRRILVSSSFILMTRQNFSGIYTSEDLAKYHQDFHRLYDKVNSTLGDLNDELETETHSNTGGKETSTTDNRTQSVADFERMFNALSGREK